MTTAAMIFAVLFTSFAVSYGWGMRGCIIGGEKGAMLPGALLGLMFARFSGSPITEDNFWILTAVGAMSMFFGGTETYAQTMSLFLHRDREGYNPAKGIAGLSIKGGLWFGICAAMLGIAVSAMTGSYYKWYDFVILFATLPLVQALGVRLLNKPYDKQKKIFPSVYFSLDRREEWGGNLFFLAELIILAAIRHDVFALLLCAFGIASGALGWIIGIVLYRLTMPDKNGKRAFGKFNDMLDGWKIMEYTLGAVGGGGIMLGRFVLNGMMKSRTDILEANGGIWSVLGNKADMLAWVAAGILAATLLQYVYIYFRNRKFADDNGMDMHKFELVERPVYAAIPLMLILLGSVNMAQIVSFLYLLWVLVEKTAFEWFADFKGITVWRIVLLAGFAGALVCEIFNGGFTAWQTWLMYCVAYTFISCVWFLRPARISEIKAKKKPGTSFLRSMGAGLTVNTYFVFQTVVLLVVGRNIL